MGQLIKIEGADFSSRPGTINVADVPAVGDGLYGFYSSAKNDVDGAGMVTYLPSFAVRSVGFNKLAQDTHGLVRESSSVWKSGFQLGANATGTGQFRGLVSEAIEIDLTKGFSFTFFWRRDAASPYNNTIPRPAFTIDALNLIFWYSRASGDVISIGTGSELTEYASGYNSTGNANEAVTIAFDQGELSIYRNSSNLGNIDITGKSFPASIVTTMRLGATTNGGSMLRNTAMKIAQLVIHDHKLSSLEVSQEHSRLSSMLA